MYNEQLEALIDAALTDGILTEKEKQVLFKKAQAMGIDLDEFEMVLDARLVKLQKEEAQKAQASAPKSNKLGDVRKCPQCGAVIGSFQMICPECGFEFNGVGPNKFVEQFSSELQKLIEKQDGVDANGKYKESRQNKAIVKAESNFVKNYPLPMTKEDCIEMLNFILPKTHLSGSNGATQVWRKKFDAILTKIELENKGNQKIVELVSSYRNQAKISGFGKIIIWYKGLSGMTKAVLWIVLYFALSIVGSCFLADDTNGIDKVRGLVESGDIEGAKVEVNKGSNSLPLYEYYMSNKMWEDAEAFIPKQYSYVSNDDYFDYCKRVVTSMCQDGQLIEAKKFIKRKVVFYEEYNNYDHESSLYKEWNTDLIEKKLNAIVDNY